MLKYISLAGSLLMLAVVTATAQAEDVGNVVDKECVNGMVKVNGTGNVVTVQGYCPKAVMSGTGNVLHIDSVGKIEISGTGNLVQYRYLNKGRGASAKTTHPIKSGGGVGNSVTWTRGEPFSGTEGE